MIGVALLLWSVGLFVLGFVMGKAWADLDNDFRNT